MDGWLEGVIGDLACGLLGLSGGGLGGTVLDLGDLDWIRGMAHRLCKNHSGIP